ncbi:hypothetical protein PYCCODRAFT_1470760 [Trametes coccinea BRFM310]|uniref:YCII-related domain-containing protein n=1 Tax=Trametes coccinea (strain BRFM310) TaxID=1353009 RepID=A0A1Y2IDM2_TRAC3|nr:hypothetical protein PYCCODRAFT_1470760 [Trametes coccinea BRFM310]
MSLPTLPKFKHNYYLFNMRDVPNAQRMKHVSSHIQATTPLIESGVIVLGGAMLPPTMKTSDADPLKRPTGSFLFVRADSLEQAWDIIKQDPFYTSGEVWDRESVTGAPVYMIMPEVRFE